MHSSLACLSDFTSLYRMLIGMIGWPSGLLHLGMLLQVRLTEIQAYLALVLERKIPVNHDIIYQLQVGRFLPY